LANFYFSMVKQASLGATNKVKQSMKTFFKAQPLLSILTLSGVMSLATVSVAQAQRVCIVNDNNQVVCGRPATDRDYNDFNRNDRSQQNFYNDINKVYQDILGRNVDNRGLEIWTRSLRNGRPLDDVRENLARTPEARNKINQLYREILGRDADAAGLQTWTSKLADGGNLRNVRRDLERSDEARNRRR